MSNFPSPRSAFPRRARAAASIVAVATALLAAACSSSPSSTGSSSSNGGGATNSLVAYSQCMRSHGVPNFPDPNGGQIPKITSGQRVGVTNSQLSTAQGACQSLWPYQASTQTQTQTQLTNYLAFAKCMRSHGVPNWPDPTNSGGHVSFNISVSRDGFNPNSSAILTKAHQCMSSLPAGSGLPTVSVSS